MNEWQSFECKFEVFCVDLYTHTHKTRALKSDWQPSLNTNFRICYFCVCVQKLVSAGFVCLFFLTAHSSIIINIKFIIIDDVVVVVVVAIAVDWKRTISKKPAPALQQHLHAHTIRMDVSVRACVWALKCNFNSFEVKKKLFFLFKFQGASFGAATAAVVAADMCVRCALLSLY